MPPAIRAFSVTNSSPHPREQIAVDRGVHVEHPPDDTGGVPNWAPEVDRVARQEQIPVDLAVDQDPPCRGNQVAVQPPVDSDRFPRSVEVALAHLAARDRQRIVGLKRLCLDRCWRSGERHGETQCGRCNATILLLPTKTLPKSIEITSVGHSTP